jgi:ABC-type phosphate transport system permease subunit
MTEASMQTEARSSAASRADLRIMANDINYIRQSVDEVKANLQGNYVTKDQFDPVKKLVYGLVGLILTAVVVGVLSLVISNRNPGATAQPTLIPGSSTK